MKTKKKVVGINNFEKMDNKILEEVINKRNSGDCKDKCCIHKWMPEIKHNL